MVVPGTAFVPAEYSGAIEALAATIDIAEDFESGEPKGYVRGSGTLTVVEEEHAGKALQLSGRTQNWHTYAYDVSAYAGATANISVFMKTEDTQIVCEVTGTGSDSKDYYNWLLNTNVTPGRVDCAFRYRNDSGRSKGAFFFNRQRNCGLSDRRC